MSSRTSAASPPGFFVDRSLGKVTAARLREQGWRLHLIIEHHLDDAQNVPYDAWIREGCQRGWSLLTIDRQIRHRAPELQAPASGSLLFCLASRQLTASAMVEALTQARSGIERATAEKDAGLWHVYRDGRVRRMWP